MPASNVDFRCRLFSFIFKEKSPYLSAKNVNLRKKYIFCIKQATGAENIGAEPKKQKSGSTLRPVIPVEGSLRGDITHRKGEKICGKNLRKVLLPKSAEHFPKTKPHKQGRIENYQEF